MGEIHHSGRIGSRRANLSHWLRFLLADFFRFQIRNVLICISGGCPSPFNWNDNRIVIPFSYLLELLHHQTLIQISMRIEHCRLVILGDGLEYLNSFVGVSRSCFDIIKLLN